MRPSLNVSLTPELEQFVQSRLASDRYQTASEVIREGRRLLEQREQARESALEEVAPRFAAEANRPIKGNCSTGTPFLRRCAS